MWDLRFLTAVTVKDTVVWDVILCSLVPCVHLCHTKRCHAPEYIDILWKKFQISILWENIPLRKIKITKGSLRDRTVGQGKAAEHTGLICVILHVQSGSWSESVPQVCHITRWVRAGYRPIPAADTVNITVLRFIKIVYFTECTLLVTQICQRRTRHSCT
jgi:hypothetical protein